ncbi:MAG: flavodoxin [Eggerthellaceae bacterium]
MAKKALVLYYSWSNGNTERIAQMAAKVLDADIERIDTAEPYPENYQETVQQGKREVKRGFRPEIRPLAHDPAEYDLVAVGTPTWWYTMAPAIATLLERCDWHDKTVVPFMTNGGWPGTVLDDMEALCPGAHFACQKEVRFDSTGGSHLITSLQELEEWTDELRKLKG